MRMTQQWWVSSRTARRSTTERRWNFLWTGAAECEENQRTGDRLQKEKACAHPALHHGHCCWRSSTHQVPGSLHSQQPHLVAAHLVHCQKGSPAPALPAEAKESTPQPINLHHLLHRHHWECANQQHLSVAWEQQRLRQEGTGKSGEVSQKNYWGCTATRWGPGETILPVKGNNNHQGPHSPLTVFSPPLRQKIPQPTMQNGEAPEQLLPICHQTFEHLQITSDTNIILTTSVY